MIITCSCKHCGGLMGIDHEEMGQAFTCPHCGQQTFIEAPRKPPAGRNPAFSDQPSSSVHWLWWVAGAVVFFGFIGFMKAMGAGELIPGLLMLVCGGFVYFVPTIVGRNKKNATAIFMLNLFLGWTFVGWVVALVWAYTKD